jgi:hypothetical protein
VCQDGLAAQEAVKTWKVSQALIATLMHGHILLKALVVARQEAYHLAVYRQDLTLNLNSATPARLSAI